MYFDYEYFCGANILVQLGDMVVTEAVAISYSIEENKLPIFGYASRHFDAVASGNVLVRGTLLINFVDQNYLYYLIKLAKNESISAPPLVSLTLTTLNPDDSNSIFDNPDGLSTEQVADLQRQYWNTAIDTFVRQPVARNAMDRPDAIHLTITFGERSPSNSYLGKTTTQIYDVYFTGRGSAIQIDENTIVESYSFIARDVGPLSKPVIITETIVPERENDPDSR